MQFTGRGGVHFVIRIVKIAVTLVTLGIYSVWATVLRTLRWFYGHTLLDSQVFSYLATPPHALRRCWPWLSSSAVCFFLPDNSGGWCHDHGTYGQPALQLDLAGPGQLLVAVTGDIGSVTDLAASLPSLLLQNAYSRDMERKADTFALDWLNTACIPPTRFADRFGRLDKGASNKTSLLSSHSCTRDRIRPFLSPGTCS